MNKFILFAALVFAAGIITPGLALGSSYQPAAEQKAEDALQSMRDAYLQNDLDGFFRFIDESPSFSWPDFKTKVAGRMTGFSPVDMNIVVDHSLIEGEKTLLKTHWEKGSVDSRTGQTEKSEGKADFTFKVTEKARLIDIQGDSPF